MIAERARALTEIAGRFWQVLSMYPLVSVHFENSLELLSLSQSEVTHAFFCNLRAFASKESSENALVSCDFGTLGVTRNQTSTSALPMTLQKIYIVLSLFLTTQHSFLHSRNIRHSLHPTLLTNVSRTFAWQSGRLYICLLPQAPLRRG
jgi:hypothetical protein